MVTLILNVAVDVCTLILNLNAYDNPYSKNIFINYYYLLNVDLYLYFRFSFTRAFVLIERIDKIRLTT